MSCYFLSIAFLLPALYLTSPVIEKSTLEVRKNVLLNTSSPCHIFELPANFQILSLDFKEKHELIQRIMISDRALDHLEECDSAAFSSCHVDASYCLVMDEPQAEFSHNLGVCTDKIYIHVYSDIPKTRLLSEDSSSEEHHREKVINLGSLETSFNYSRQCSSHLSKDEEIAMHCATLSHQECYSEDECDSECQWISCTYNSYNQRDFFKEFTLCLPANIYAEERICYDHYDYVNSPNKRFSFKKCGYPLNSYKLPGKEGATAPTIIIIILLVLILLFLGSICYYRWSLSQKKVAPFTPPGFCPDWIYPRVEYDHHRKPKPMINRNEYRPPDD